MGTWKVSKMSLMAFLLVGFMAGCGQERGTLPPTLTAINPNTGVQGQTEGVTLTGTNFATGATVNVGGALITVTNTTVVSSTQITATFAIAANAVLGAVPISVTTSGLTTNTVTFTIVSPQLTSITPNTGEQRQTEAVTLIGTNFATGATINVGGALITVTNTTVVSSTQITATFAIAANAVLGAVPISVTTAGVTTNTVTFTITPGFVVTSTIPANLATGVALNSTVSATFNLPVTCSTLNSPATNFTVTIIGVPVAGTVTCAGSTATFTPTSNLAPNVTYTATISTGATDLAGVGLALPYVWNFTTVVLPQVISTVPFNGQTGVTLNQAISATFSEAMNPATLNTPATNFILTTLVGGVVTPVAGTVNYVTAGSTATFTPTLPLNPTTLYTATIKTGAQDPAGNGLLVPYVWSFTTGATPDITPPFIISTIPANNAVAVPINQAITATFNEPMDPLTITAATFKLTGPGGAVAGTVTYAAISNTATFTPTALLANSTVYTAQVTIGAKDLAGNPLGLGPVPNPWTFTTAPVPDIDNPTITLTNPADMATGVAVNATVNATFNEAMNPLTISTTTFLLAGPGGIVIPGTVAYDSINFIATFIPSSNLAAGTKYTATVTNGAQDLSGNPLVAGLVPNPWSFTTAAVMLPPPVPLGTASTFGSFGGGAGITNMGITTVINGDIGTTGVSTVITGFHDNSIPYLPPAGCIYTETPLNVGTVNGKIYTAPPPPTVTCPNEGTAVTFAVATQAAADTLTAFNFTSAANLACTVCAQGGELGGLTLAPGVYKSAPGTFGITAGDLTLDAQGNANAFWVFQAATSLTVGLAAQPRSVILINGAQAKNVFWHVGSAATINAAGGGTMVGTILAQSGISFSTAGNVVLTVLNGRALVLTGPVTMVDTVINVPGP